ncbi:tetratricopeptide repeat-containing sensor histidine kinase [Roseivirga echinicomitans]|uniref:tetratricopeptide repeat-containing sensor histidine kinase n=1 Tax=Roseivirga echinicomitans TaxID=296218 RepID=UPI000A6996B3|nr:sensor histidine kinase [Roseivirga echinicomitans]
MVPRSLLFLVCFFGAINLAHSQSVEDSLKVALKNAPDSGKVPILINLAKVSQDNNQSLIYAKQALSYAKLDSEKSSAANQIAWTFKNLFQFDSAKVYVKKALGYAEKGNDLLITSDAYSTYGSVFYNIGSYDSALFYNKKALEYRIEAGDKQAQAASMNNISTTLQRLSRYGESMEYINQSISIYLASNDKRSAADSYLNKGNLLNSLGAMDSAYVSFQNALKEYESLGLKSMMPYALINMATVAVHLDRLEEAQKGFVKSRDILLEGEKNPQLLGFSYNGIGGVYQTKDMYDSALLMFLEGEKYALLAQNEYLISMVYNNLGDTYAHKKEYKTAITYLDKAYELKTKIGDQAGLASVSITLASTYANLRDYKKADKFYLEGIKLAEQVDDKVTKRKAYNEMYLFQKEIGNFSHSLDYLEKFMALDDSLINDRNLDKIAELNTQYETEKKEQQIALQDAQLGEQELMLERNRLLMIGLILIAVLFLSVIFLIKNRAKKNEQLILQEGQLKLRDAELNAVINSQEKERSRFARDLHDGFGQLISVLKLNLSGLNDTDAQYPEKRMEVFKNGESVINDMYAELRSICFDLMPQTLVKKGVTIALKEFGDRITQSKKVVCEVIVFSNKERLPEVVEISLFRICQEWVNNVMKYAEASHITIQLTRDEEELTLTVEDNGKGFEADLFYSGKGNGWKNIQTRLNLIKGEFDLDTQPNRGGTMMTVNLLEVEMKEVSANAERSITV